MSVEDKILEIILQEAPHCKIGDTESKTLPFVDVGLDSLDMMTVLLNIGDEFGVDIPDEDINGLNTFAKLAAYVVARAGESA